jgi:hypothetical protein
MESRSLIQSDAVRTIDLQMAGALGVRGGIRRTERSDYIHPWMNPQPQIQLTENRKYLGKNYVHMEHVQTFLVIILRKT